MNSIPWWRRPSGSFVVDPTSLFLIAVLLIVVITAVSAFVAVLRQPVAVENKQQLEQQFNQNYRQAADEYEAAGEKDGRDKR